MYLRKFILFFLIFSFSILNVFSISYITELNFKNIEFVELFSNNSINLSSAIVYDENNKNQSLIPIQIKNSSNFLIVGTNFLKNYKNLTKFNCSIFSTQSSGPGYRGLKDLGESFYIILKNNTKISYINLRQWNFKINQSLFFNLNNNSYYISKTNICGYNVSINNTIINNKTSNNSILNLSNQTKTIFTKQILCDNSFKIKTDSLIFFNNIFFSFQTNSSNFSITYWIENLSSIVKKNITTSSLLKKQFSPKTNKDIFFIKAKLFSNNCIYSATSTIFFYSNLSSSNLNINLNQVKKPYLYFDSKNLTYSNFIFLNAYRANLSKHTIKLYKNNTLINIFYLDKFSKLKFKIFFDKHFCEKYRTEGLGFIKNFYFCPPEDKNLINISKIKKNTISDIKHYFYISNLISVNKENINFSILTNFINFTYFCYLTQKKLKISDIISKNFSEFNLKKINLTLHIKDNLIRDFGNILNLSIICKYKKNKFKTFIYLRRDLLLDLKLKHNFSSINLQKKIKENDLLNKFANLNFKNISKIKTYKIFNSNFLFENKNLTNQNLIYETKALKNQNLSLDFIFFATSGLLIILLIFW